MLSTHMVPDKLFLSTPSMVNPYALNTQNSWYTPTLEAVIALDLMLAAETCFYIPIRLRLIVSNLLGLSKPIVLDYFYITVHNNNLSDLLVCHKKKFFFK